MKSTDFIDLIKNVKNPKNKGLLGLEQKVHLVGIEVYYCMQK